MTNLTLTAVAKAIDGAMDEATILLRNRTDYDTTILAQAAYDAVMSGEEVRGLVKFIASLTKADGPYPELDGKPIVGHARRVLAPFTASGVKDE